MAEEAKPVVHEFTEEQVEGKKEIFSIYGGLELELKFGMLRIQGWFRTL